MALSKSLGCGSGSHVADELRPRCLKSGVGELPGVIVAGSSSFRALRLVTHQILDGAAEPPEILADDLPDRLEEFEHPSPVFYCYGRPREHGLVRGTAPSFVKLRHR